MKASSSMGTIVLAQLFKYCPAPYNYNADHGSPWEKRQRMSHEVECIEGNKISGVRASGGECCPLEQLLRCFDACGGTSSLTSNSLLLI